MSNGTTTAPTKKATKTQVYAVDCYKKDGEDDDGTELWRVGGWVVVRAASVPEAKKLAAGICPYQAVDYDVMEWKKPVSVDKLGKFHSR